MYFGHKHAETGLNCSHQLATFLKYHMPLKAMLYQHTNFRFFYCFENYKSSVTKTTVTCELNVRLS